MSVREPAVAGTFYPKSDSGIQEFCRAHLTSGLPQINAKAVILPHAGYIYSGKTACHVLSRIQIPDTIFLIGPNHQGIGAEFAMMTQGAWQTPLGKVPVDSELALKILQSSPEIEDDPQAHRFEHSLEVEIPLLQSKNPKISIIPMVVSTMELKKAKVIAQTCGRVIAASKGRILTVISTDMSHYEDDKTTRVKDQYALQAIQNCDEEALMKAVTKHGITMCGLIPVYMLLAMKKELKLEAGTLVEYTTSAETSGDYNRVVGYAGFIFE